MLVICRDCGLEKEKFKGRRCKECNAVARSISQRKTYEKRRAIAMSTVVMVTCIDCGLEKEKHKGNQGNRCEECGKKSNAKGVKKCKNTNPETNKATNKKYRDTHKDEIRERKRKDKKRRRAVDPSFVLMSDISRAVNKAMAQSGSSKQGESTFKHLGYTIEKLWSYLEQGFSSPENLTPDGKIWMTRYNRGVYNPKFWKPNDPSTWKWQLDHIIPQSDLPYTSYDDENFKKCWALENLRPLGAKQNNIDGVTRSRHKIKQLD